MASATDPQNPFCVLIFIPHASTKQLRCQLGGRVIPRNGSGTFTISNSFSSGTTISSSQTNANNADIGAEITGSLPRDGQAGMTAQLPLANGTVSVPALGFSSDTDTGFYRIGANNIGLAIGGSKVLDISSTGMAITGEVTTTNGPLPSGTKTLFYADSAPAGWTIFTTSVDDRALRVVSGSGAGGGTGGALAGTTAFSTIMAARTIDVTNLPNTTIHITDPGHVHTVPFAAISFQQGSGAASAVGVTSSVNSGSATTGISAAIDNTARGGAQAAMDFAVKYASVIIATKN